MMRSVLLDRRRCLTLLTTAAWLPGAARAAMTTLSFGDAVMTIEFDNRLYSRIIAKGKALSGFAPTEVVRTADGGVLTDFAYVEQTRTAVSDAHGKGTRFEIAGRSAGGVKKRVSVTLYARYPGFALVKTSYVNGGAAPLAISGWSNGAHCLKAAGDGFWSWSGASFPDRRDWIQPVRAGFDQANFMGMNASDYGSGTPVVDVWRRDVGLAVGHVETRPQLVSLPLISTPEGAAVAVSADTAVTVEPGKSFETLTTFVAVHGGDCFAPLSSYRQVMSDQGLKSPVPPAGSYEAIWCAWGYGRKFTPDQVTGSLSKVRELGLKWAVIDDGWQTNEGDWYLSPSKFTHGERDMIEMVQRIKSYGLKPKLWISPLAVSPGSDLLHDHSDMLLKDRDGAPQLVTWWNAFYLCPAYPPVRAHMAGLVTKIFRDWGFEGLKIDGQHLNGVAPCHNPLHNHARPEESVEGLQDFWATVYDAAVKANPQAVVEICPCGDCYAYFNMPYMNQAPASDPLSSWQVRLKGKSLKALMGPSAPFAGDHVELSDGGDDFASTVGIGAVVSTKFTWPGEGGEGKEHFQLTAEKEALWRQWVGIYNDKRLAEGVYRGELYDIGFDKPETHVVEKDGRLYYAFYGDWDGPVEFRGLKGRYRLRDYVNQVELGTVSGDAATVGVSFMRFLLVEAEKVG